MREHGPCGLLLVVGSSADAQLATLPMQLFSMPAAVGATMSMMVVDPRMATMDTSSFVVGAGLLQFFDCSRLGLRVTQQAAFCELRPEVGFVIN